MAKTMFLWNMEHTKKINVAHVKAFNIRPIPEVNVDSEGNKWVLEATTFTNEHHWIEKSTTRERLEVMVDELTGLGGKGGSKDD